MITYNSADGTAGCRQVSELLRLHGAFKYPPQARGGGAVQAEMHNV